MSLFSFFPDAFARVPLQKTNQQPNRGESSPRLGLFYSFKARSGALKPQSQWLR
jgi:hypothetical protein